jgi:hypothetical protein
MSKICFQSVCPSPLVLQPKLMLLNRGWPNENETNPDMHEIHTSLKKCKIRKGKIKQITFCNIFFKNSIPMYIFIINVVGWTINFRCAALYTYIPT